MISYKVDNQTVNVRIWSFPDSSIGTDINSGSAYPVSNVKLVTVTVLFGDLDFNINDTLFALETVMDALKLRYPHSKFNLNIPYVPYSRQDRICVAGEGHSLKIVARRINSLGFNVVSVVDPHSTVTEALIEQCYPIDQFSVFGKVHTSFREKYIVAPDTGALKKCEDFARKVGAAGVITCQKRRDMNTGRIVDFKIVGAESIPQGSDFFVLDDLCDKGGTFLAVADQILKLNPNSLELAVTHGLFTHDQGVLPLLDLYDRIYTSSSYIRPRKEQQNDLLKVIDLDRVGV